MAAKRPDITDNQVLCVYREHMVINAAVRDALGLSWHAIRHRLRRINNEIRYKWKLSRKRKVTNMGILRAFKIAGSLRGTARLCSISYTTARNRLYALTDASIGLPRIKCRDKCGLFKSLDKKNQLM